MQAAITKRLVDELLSQARDRDLFVFDPGLSGLVLKLTPAGRAVFQLRYRMGGRGTKLTTLTLGRYGELTPDGARKLAQATLGDIRRGIDPSAEKKRRAAEDRSARTVASLADEFLEVYGSTKLKQRSREEYARNLRQHALPRIGKVAMRDLTHGDIERMHHSLRHIPATANRTVAAVSKLCSWAIKGGHRPDRINPCAGLEKFREQGRERFLSFDEISALARAITRCEEAGDISRWHAGLLRALMLTGLRRDELRTITWSAVDFEAKLIRLPDTKTGPRWVPMSEPLAALLRAVPRVDGNTHVFVGSRAGQPIINIAKPWRRVLTVAAIAPTRLHDLRHSAASVAVGAGASLPQIGAVLGHANEATTKRYAHLADDIARSTANTIAERVQAAMDAPPSKQN